MTRSRRARWRLVAAVACVGVAVVAMLLMARLVTGGVAVLGACVAVSWWVGPFRPHVGVPHWTAQERHVQSGIPIIYCRPGSLRCWMLRLVLGRKGDRAIWVDIWADEEAAAFVRDVNGGAETVPTVIMRNGDAVTQPDAYRVAEELSLAS